MYWRHSIMSEYIFMVYFQIFFSTDGSQWTEPTFCPGVPRSGPQQYLTFPSGESSVWATLHWQGPERSPQGPREWPEPRSHINAQQPEWLCYHGGEAICLSEDNHWGWLHTEASPSWDAQAPLSEEAVEHYPAGGVAGLPRLGGVCSGFQNTIDSINHWIIFYLL